MIRVTARRLQQAAVAAVFVLAGCGGSAAPSSAPVAPASAASSGARTPSASENAAGSSASSGSASSGSSSNATTSAPVAGSPAAPANRAPIKVGLMEALTGPLASVGKDNQDGFNLYLDSVNQTMAGRKIQATFADGQGQPDVALTKMKQLVENDKVQVLMGMTATPVCYAAGTYVKQAQIPLVVSGACGAVTLLTDPKFKSPYITRFTMNSLAFTAPVGDWAYKQGYRKAILLSADYGGGIEVADGAARGFVEHGGQIVQEMHPAQGTTDFGPFLAQLNPSADVIFAFENGSDGLRFGEQLATYGAQHKPPVVDLSAVMTSGPNLIQLKDKALGMVAEFVYTDALDTPENQTMLKAFHQKYPGRLISPDIAQGYTGAMVLEAALKKVNGNVEDKQAFLNALYGTDIATPKGAVKLDSNHDVVENVYFYQIIKNGSGYGQKLLDTYHNVSPAFDFLPGQDPTKFPIGKLKGKWVGMTKDKLNALIK